jgi:hypothetical protein
MASISSPYHRGDQTKSILNPRAPNTPGAEIDARGAMAGSSTAATRQSRRCHRARDEYRLRSLQFFPCGAHTARPALYSRVPSVHRWGGGHRPLKHARHWNGRRPVVSSVKSSTSLPGLRTSISNNVQRAGWHAMIVALKTARRNERGRQCRTSGRQRRLEANRTLSDRKRSELG